MPKPEERIARELLLAKRNKLPTRPCRLCDTVFLASQSQCPSCGAFHVPESSWGKPANGADGTTALVTDATLLLSEVPETELERIQTGPWDHCFGGGLARTSVNLIGGAPGAGKSTLSLQISDKIAGKLVPEQGRAVEILYIGAEESAAEIKARAVRLNLENLARIRLLPMGAIQNISDVMLSRRPRAVILDSLPGFVSDPEEAVEMCTRLKGYAVELNAPMIVIDHITKADDFAGLMTLQHAVDGLFTLYPDDSGLRTFSTVKNRFGPAQVEVFFLMTPTGLVEVDPADLENDDDDPEGDD